MTIVKKLGATIAALALAATLAACGGDSDDPTPSNNPGDSTSEPTAPDGPTSDSLQEYVDLVVSQSASMLAGFEDIYSDISIYGEGSSTIVYSYTFIDYIEPEIGRESLGQQVEMLQSMADSMLFAEMERFGIDDPKVRYTYINSDNTELFTVLLEK